MTIDATSPLLLDDPSDAAGHAGAMHDPAVQRLVDFFRSKGLAQRKREDREETWYQDWIDYQQEHGLYAALLSPAQHSSRGHRFDLRRLARFLEVFAYFSPAHAYSLHVSFLGLFPILMSDNDRLKQEAIERLEAGGLFAFAVSEREHGSDLLANEFVLSQSPNTDGWRANGAKYYIGNANAAGMVSVLAKKSHDGALPSRRSGFAFFALRPDSSPAYRNVQKIRTLGIRQAFVGAFEVIDHPVARDDIISEGRDAWDAVFDTVNLGKFLLGFGAIGICAHAFAEADHHLRRRVLYGKPAIDMPHLRETTAIAYARLTAMKHYAYRALDYVQTATADDRRFLLFNAVQKARVSTEGVKVMSILSECIGARGVESETYFEQALRDAQLIPGLEGSTHINFGLTAQFVDTYFADAGDTDIAEPPHDADVGENPYLMKPGDRNAKTVRFADCLRAYAPLASHETVQGCIEQVKAFRRFVQEGGTDHARAGDVGVRIALGRSFSTIAYAQLIAERCAVIAVEQPMISLIFHALTEDLSMDALRLAGFFSSDSHPRARLEQVVTLPRTDLSDHEAVAELIAARYGHS